MSTSADGDGEEPGTFTEEIEVTGSQLIEWVGHLLKDGNVRQIRIKAPGGQLSLETPADAGGEGAALAAPWLAILGALAALVARVRIEIVRVGMVPGADIAALWDDGGDLPGA